MNDTQPARVWKFADGEMTESDDALAAEEPLEIRVRGRAISVTMRTPGHDAELAAGFLLTENVIRQRSDIFQIQHCDRDTEEAENTLNVLLDPLVSIDLDRLTRHVFASSSCGLCGKATIDAVRQHSPAIKSDATIATDKLLALPVRMRQAQDAFGRTGGLHAAAVFDSDGGLIVLREDVGRHNAVDKVIGYAFLTGRPLDDCVLLISGRASFEIMQKALAARIPIVAAVSAPSSLAVKFACESGQTLIGFLRERRLNVYACPRRITA